MVGILGQDDGRHAGAGDPAPGRWIRPRRGGRWRARRPRPARRAPSWSAPSAGRRSGFPGHARAACAHPARAGGILKIVATFADPGGLVPGHPAARARGTRSGSACRRRAPRSPAGSTRSSTALGRRAAPRGHVRTTTRCSRRSTTSELLAFLEGASSAWEQGPYAELVGQDRVVPVLLPDRRAARRHGAVARRCAARADRPVLLRHDDPGRPRHLGGRAGRGRLRADRRRPGRRG